tara:strand:- start:790 stop:954 length:165 start_codon:yes stop_codon:yes gene_type:complete
MKNKKELSSDLRNIGVGMFVVSIAEIIKNQKVGIIIFLTSIFYFVIGHFLIKGD